MKKGDVLWGATVFAIAMIFIFPITREPLIATMAAFPMLSGFFKFFVLATLGDLLGIRIGEGNWRAPMGLIHRMVAWGIIGVMITLVFKVYSVGVTAAIDNGLLPIGSGMGSELIIAFWISLIMNVTFGPMMMVFHRLTDTFIDLAQGKISKFSTVSSKAILKKVDWEQLMVFALKINLCLWVPVHAIVFLLPAEYRVLTAASLSIVLGAILGYAKKQRTSALVN